MKIKSQFAFNIIILTIKTCPVVPYRSSYHEYVVVYHISSKNFEQNK